MGALKVVSKRWWMQRKLVFGLTLLTVAALTPVLSLSLVAPAAQGDGVGEMREDVENGGVGSIPLLGPDDIRNPETASKYGIAGYVRFTWMDSRQQIVITRGESWSGTLLVHFVSYTSELTELELLMDPNATANHMVGKYYLREDGSRAFFDFSTLLSYDPSGIITLNAGKTLQVTATVHIPKDFPKAIPSFPLHAMGIHLDQPGVGFIDDTVTATTNEVLVI